MNKAKILRGLSAAVKTLGLIAAFDKIPFIPPQYGVLIVLIASASKDWLQSLGDLLDDGIQNKSFLVALGLIVFGSGCAGFYSRQLDRSYFGPDGKTLARSETETIVRARTVWDGKSQLANFAASQSAKTQSTKVGALTAESSGTNALAIVRELRGIAEAVSK